MAANIAAVRAEVRQDRHDEDAAAYRWTDAVLDRHITRAVAEYSLHRPREQKTTLVTVTGSRDISIASLTNLIDIVAVEWPTLEFPPRLVGVTRWLTTITLDVVAAPSSVQNVFVYWLRDHTLDGSSSTIDAIHDDVIEAGAAAYAALDWTSFAINKINTGGDDVQRRYAAFAAERLTYFEAELRRLSRANVVRQRRMYVTDAPSIFEQQRVKY
jgi:heptaprenylglyceryl phosphate synthase